MKRIFISLLAIIMAMSMIFAREKEVILLNDGNAKLTVYHPALPNGKALMMCPGGGYVNLAIDHEGHQMADWFNNLGITYAVLDYRRPQKPLDFLPMIDAHAGLQAIAENAEAWNIDPKQIGIAGASAGGHLAAYTANTDSLVAFQVLFYPVISMREGVTHSGSRNNLIGPNPTEEMTAKTSVAEIVDATTPRAFIMLSADDTVVIPANSIEYFNALNRNHIPVELHIYPTGGHGWGFRDSFVHKPQWTMALQQWLSNF